MRKTVGVFFCAIYMAQSDTKSGSNNTSKFECILCDFKCCKQSEWNRHILTLKHQHDTSVTQVKQQNASIHTCSCGQILKSRSTIWRHKKTCQKKEEPNFTDKDIIKMLLKDNSELKAMILEVVKSVQPNTTNNSNNTVNNNTTNNNFNLQIFLNETCKDALNLTDFVASLQVKLKDLEETAKIGYTNGVSRIFINGLNDLEVNMRPIHCSDLKREILYIKNNDEWTKEGSDKSNITKAIKKVSNQNIQQIFEWQKKYPEYNNSESKQNDRYQVMVFTALGGSTDEEQANNFNKIIRNITKEVVIDKTI